MNIKKWLFKTTDGEIIITQRPNWPIIVWLVLSVLSRFVSGDLAKVASYLASSALIYWAVLEIYSGVNFFRRILGAIVLLAVVAL